MSSITYTDNVTVIPSAWLNDVNTVTYTLFGDGSSYNGTFKLGTSGMTVTGSATAWGFGVTPKTWTGVKALEVGVTGNGIWNAGGASDIRMAANYYYDGASRFAGTGYAAQYEQGSGVHTWYTSSVSGTAGNVATMNTHMTLGVSGTFTVSGDSSADFVKVGEGMRGLVIGNVSARATTDPTNSIRIFQGTAPVGTSGNTIDLYNTAGELRVMDGGGNATLLSPHDGDRNWIHHCVKGDGNEILIRMEQMAQFLNKKYGKEFKDETGVPFIEEYKTKIVEDEKGNRKVTRIND